VGEVVGDLVGYCCDDGDAVGRFDDVGDDVGVYGNVGKAVGNLGDDVGEQDNGDLVGLIDGDAV